MSRFVFDDTARFFRDSTLYQNLYQVLPQCRKDIVYDWSYSSGIVSIGFTDSQPCMSGEPSRLDEGIIIREQNQNFLNSGEAEFKGQWDAINKFVDINAGGPGITGWNQFDMTWSDIVFAKDSINITGTFSELERNTPLPKFSIQFLPI